MAAPPKSIVRFAPDTVRSRKMSKGTSGATARRSMATNAPSSAAAAAKTASVRVEVQPVGLGLHDPDFAIHTADDGPRTRLGSGELVPERVIPASQRSMAVILDAIDALPAARKPRRALPAALVAELGAWTERVGRGALPPGTLLGGVVFWSRLHGLISLELDHHLASMQLDPELLYRAELAELGGET